MSQKTVLIVDDEEKILEIVSSYLKKEGYNIFQAVNGNQAIQIIKSQTVHCIILDLMLPDIQGEKVCRVIRSFSRVPIIMLTAKVDEEDVIRGFCEGSDDYMTKPFSPKELIMRVKALIRRSQGEALQDIIILDQGDLIINTKNMEVLSKGSPIKLTPNESRILEILCANPQRVFSREDLIQYALGDNYTASDRTMDTYIKNIRKKIEKNHKKPCHLLTVHGLGYKFSMGTANES